jgi:hypothetical protein
MDTSVFEDWLYLADMYTGVWWYKMFLVVYYLVAIVVVRFIWRRTRTVPMSSARRCTWLLLAAATVAPCVVALGAGIVAPFPVGAYFYIGLAIDGYVRAAAVESLIAVAVLLTVWVLLTGGSALSNKSLERTREG